MARPVEPVTFSVEPQAANRQRLSVAFRPILALPHLLLVGGPGVGIGGGMNHTGVFGLAATVCAIVNWFVILFTGQAIEGLQGLQVTYLQWRANALAYEALLRDEYPPFGEGAYPVQAHFTAVREGRQRLSVAFRLILLIPHAILLTFVFIAWIVTVIIGWFAVLFTGTYPEGLWRFGEGAMRWSLRVEAYGLLLHDEYPPFSLS